MTNQLPVQITRKLWKILQFSSVAWSCLTLQPHGLQHSRPPCPSPIPGLHPNSCTSRWWCHPAISSSSSPFLPVPNPSKHQGLFQWVNSLHEVAKVLEFQLQHQSFQWTPKGLISFRMDWLDLLAVQGLSRAFSSTTVQKHQFFGAQLSSQCNSHIHPDLRLSVVYVLLTSYVPGIVLNGLHGWVSSWKRVGEYKPCMIIRTSTGRGWKHKLLWTNRCSIGSVLSIMECSQENIVLENCLVLQMFPGSCILRVGYSSTYVPRICPRGHWTKGQAESQLN